MRLFISGVLRFLRPRELAPAALQTGERFSRRVLFIFFAESERAVAESLSERAQAQTRAADARALTDFVICPNALCCRSIFPLSLSLRHKQSGLFVHRVLFFIP
jgi:hypothetical protein